MFLSVGVEIDAFEEDQDDLVAFQVLDPPNRSHDHIKNAFFKVFLCRQIVVYTFELVSQDYFAAFFQSQVKFSFGSSCGGKLREGESVSRLDELLVDMHQSLKAVLQLFFLFLFQLAFATISDDHKLSL